MGLTGSLPCVASQSRMDDVATDKRVPLCCRDVDETISWIKEKEQLLASDDFGRDLASVQALLRKHEGLERDLAALEDKVGLEGSCFCD